jgi:hypothetical protein
MTLDMREALRIAAAKAYGGKGKSRWVREALWDLNAEDPALTTVGFGERIAVRVGCPHPKTGSSCGGGAVADSPRGYPETTSTVSLTVAENYAVSN